MASPHSSSDHTPSDHKETPRPSSSSNKGPKIIWAILGICGLAAGGYWFAHLPHHNQIKGPAVPPQRFGGIFGSNPVPYQPASQYKDRHQTKILGFKARKNSSAHIIGSAPPHSLIRLTVDDNVLVVTQSDANGNWSATFPAERLGHRTRQTVTLEKESPEHKGYFTEIRKYKQIYKKGKYNLQRIPTLRPSLSGKVPPEVVSSNTARFQPANTSQAQHPTLLAEQFKIAQAQTGDGIDAKPAPPADKTTGSPGMMEKIFELFTRKPTTKETTPAEPSKPEATTKKLPLPAATPTQHEQAQNETRPVKTRERNKNLLIPPPSSTQERTESRKNPAHLKPVLSPASTASPKRNSQSENRKTGGIATDVLDTEKKTTSRKNTHKAARKKNIAKRRGKNRRKYIRKARKSRKWRQRRARIRRHRRYGRHSYRRRAARYKKYRRKKYPAKVRPARYARYNKRRGRISRKRAVYRNRTRHPYRSKRRLRAIRYGRSIRARYGDTLWALAKIRYGRGSYYKKIVRINRGRIRNPNRIRAGQHIRLKARS